MKYFGEKFSELINESNHLQMTRFLHTLIIFVIVGLVFTHFSLDALHRKIDHIEKHVSIIYEKVTDQKYISDKDETDDFFF